MKQEKKILKENVQILKNFNFYLFLYKFLYIFY